MATILPFKTAEIKIRCTEAEKQKITFLAKTYAGGNMSAWLLWAAINAPRKFLKPKK